MQVLNKYRSVRLASLLFTVSLSAATYCTSRRLAVVFCSLVDYLSSLWIFSVRALIVIDEDRITLLLTEVSFGRSFDPFDSCVNVYLVK